MVCEVLGLYIFLVTANDVGWPIPIHVFFFPLKISKNLRDARNNEAGLTPLLHWLEKNNPTPASSSDYCLDRANKHND